jgi:(E)-4-hydroxy-3-methylbut-2-enyl-diphosphate synthase
VPRERARRDRRCDLGLWCGPTFVNLKRGKRELGAYRYDEILGRLKGELDSLIAERERNPI